MCSSDLQTAGAAVARIRTPLDPSICLHAIDLSHQCHRFDLEEIRKTGLVNTLVPSKVGEDAALRAVETKEQQGSLIEAPGEQASHIVDEITKAALEIHGSNRKQPPRSDYKL